MTAKHQTRIKIVGALLLLALIMTTATTGCISTDDNPQTASYTERNFQFVGNWVYTVNDANWMIMALSDDNTGMILGKTNGEEFVLDIVWVERELQTGAKVGIINMDDEYVSIIRSTKDSDEMLYYLNEDYLEEDKSIKFIRHGSE